MNTQLSREESERLKKNTGDQPGKNTSKGYSAGLQDEICLDDGLQFGLGAFETICLMKGEPVLLDWHLERLNRSLETFGIDQRAAEAEVLQWLAMNTASSGDADDSAPQAMKILVTSENKLMMLRSNPYTEERIQQGFSLDYSPIKRNETSPFVYHKTLNYGDNILEKRRTRDLPIDEVLFLNTRGELTEGSTTNLFLVLDGVLVTPDASCGLLPGVMRRFVLEHFPCEERILYPEDLERAEECFVTNSLMGIMPVIAAAGKLFSTGPVTEQVITEYRLFCMKR